MNESVGHPAVVSVGVGPDHVYREGELAAQVNIAPCGTPMLLVRVGLDALLGLELYQARAMRFLVDHLMPQLDSLTEVNGHGVCCD